MSLLFVHNIYTITAHMGRIVGQSQFEQPLFMDVLTQSLGPIAGHGFITTFCLVGVSYLMTIPLNGTPLHAFPLPLFAALGYCSWSYRFFNWGCSLRC